jgi:hypothetical protein
VETDRVTAPPFLRSREQNPAIWRFSVSETRARRARRRRLPRGAGRRARRHDGSGVTRASSSRFGFTRPPELADIGRWHTSPFAAGSKWYDAFFGGPVDRDLFEFDAATVATAVDWLAEGLPEPWCLFVPLVFPHPPFTVEQRWYDLYRETEVPAPVPPVLDGKPGFHREIRERYGLSRLGEDDWAEIIRTYYAILSGGRPARRRAGSGRARWSR